MDELINELNEIAENFEDIEVEDIDFEGIFKKVEDYVNNLL